MYTYIDVYTTNLCAVLISAWCLYTGTTFGPPVCRPLYTQFSGKSKNKYIRGYFQTSTVSEWIYYFLRFNVNTQKMAQFLFWKIQNTSTLFQSTWNLSSLIYLVCGVFRQFWDSTTIIRFHMKWKTFLHQCCTIQWRKRWHHPPSSGG